MVALPLTPTMATRTYEARGLTADGREVVETVLVRWLAEEGYFLITVWPCNGEPPENLAYASAAEGADALNELALRCKARLEAVIAGAR